MNYNINKIHTIQVLQIADRRQLKSTSDKICRFSKKPVDKY